MKKITLRPYQQEILDKIDAYLKNDDIVMKRGLVISPVGSGKSICISSTAHMLKGKTVVIQPTVELLNQNLEKLRAIGGDAKVYSAGAKSKELGDITYATIGSIYKKAKEFKKHGVVNVIVDECNQYPPTKGSMFRQFIDIVNPKIIIGFTATPCRLYSGLGEMNDSYSVINFITNKILRNTPFLKDVIHIVQVKDIADKFWSKTMYEQHDFDEGKLRWNSTGSEYTETSIQEAISAQGINNNIYKRVKKLNAEGITKTLTFCDSLETASRMAELIPKSAYLAGSTDAKEREKIITDFKKGKIWNVFNYGILTCLSTDTEVLTKNGWKTKKYLKPNDEVAQYDMETGVITFEKPIHIHQHTHTTSMVQVANNELTNLRVTNDHDMVILNKKGVYHKTKAHNIVGKEVTIPTAGVVIKPKLEKIDYDKCLKLAMLLRMSCNNVSSLRYILQDLTRGEFLEVVRVFCRAYRQPKSKVYSNIHFNKDVLDLLQEIAVCNGITSTIEPLDEGYFKITFYLTNKVTLSNEDAKLHKIVKEEVWCMTMSKGTLITRRKGKIAIMGNTGFDYPELQAVIMGRPTGSYVLHYQILGRGVRQHPDKDHVLLIDYGNNVKRFGKLEDLRVEFIPGRGWQMFAQGKQLTGVRIGSEDNAMPYEPQKKFQADIRKKFPDSGITFDFGKYVGKKPSEAPESYLKWVVENIFPRGPWDRNREKLLIECAQVLDYITKLKKSAK